MDRKTVSRREFLRMSAVIAFGVGVAACQPAPGQPAAGAGKATQPGAETVTISFMGWGGPEEAQAVLDLIARFEEKNPGVKVTWLHTPEDYMSKLTAMIAANTPPDTLFTPQDYYKTFCKQGLMLDIQPWLDTDPVLKDKNYFLQPQEDSRSAFEGKWHGIGCCWVGGHLFYNADMFKEANIEPPSTDPDKAWTWDHFVEVAKQLTLDSKGKHPGDAGFNPQDIVQWGVDHQTGGYFPETFLYQNGVDSYDPASNKFKFAEAAATEGLQNVADLMFKHHVAPIASNLKDLGMSNTQMLENRKLAMAVDGTYALAWTHKIKATLGVACLPKMQRTGTIVVADVRAAMKATKHPEEAYKWVRMTADPVYQSTFLKIGLWWPNQTALMTPDGLKSWINERKSPTEGVHPPGYYDLVDKYVRNHTEAWLCPPGFAEAKQIVVSALESVWNGTQTAQQAMEGSIDKANAVLAKSNS
ncbi:MAG: extracellular solute-binding protein [Caldilineaceae bacterium]